MDIDEIERVSHCDMVGIEPDIREGGVRELMHLLGSPGLEIEILFRSLPH